MIICRPAQSWLIIRNRLRSATIYAPPHCRRSFRYDRSTQHRWHLHLRWIQVKEPPKIITSTSNASILLGKPSNTNSSMVLEPSKIITLLTVLLLPLLRWSKNLKKWPQSTVQRIRTFLFDIQDSLIPSRIPPGCLHHVHAFQLNKWNPKVYRWR